MAYTNTRSVFVSALVERGDALACGCLRDTTPPSRTAFGPGCPEDVADYEISAHGVYKGPYLKGKTSHSPHNPQQEWFGVCCGKGVSMLVEHTELSGVDE
jgi:hypothetical protein